MLYEPRAQHLLFRSKRAGIDFSLVAARLRQRPTQIAIIGSFEHPGAVDVGAVDRKAGDQLRARAAQQTLREIGGARILAREPRQIASQHIELARHLLVHDVQLAQAPDFREFTALAGKLRIHFREGGLGRLIDQQGGNLIEEIVAPSAPPGASWSRGETGWPSGASPGSGGRPPATTCKVRVHEFKW